MEEDSEQRICLCISALKTELIIGETVIVVVTIIAIIIIVVVVVIKCRIIEINWKLIYSLSLKRISLIFGIRRFRKIKIRKSRKIKEV